MRRSCLLLKIVQASQSVGSRRRTWGGGVCQELRQQARRLLLLAKLPGELQGHGEARLHWQLLLLCVQRLLRRQLRVELLLRLRSHLLHHLLYEVRWHYLLCRNGWPHAVHGRRWKHGQHL